jgi:non-ribosomal peptide synthetase component F
MLAIRTFPCKHKTFREFLQEVKKDALDAFENQEYQFPQLVKRLGLKRISNRNPLFDVVFQLNNIDSLAPIHIPGLKTGSYGSVNTICQFDMILGAAESDGAIGFNLAYSNELFKKDTAEKFTRRFLEVIDQVIDDVNVKIVDIQLSHHLIVSTSTSLDSDRGDFDF